MCEQNVSYLAKHSELGSKNLNKIRLKIIEKALKEPLQRVNFQNSSGAACPQTPYSFSCLSITSKFVLPKKMHQKKCGNYGPPLLKFLATILSTTAFRLILHAFSYHNFLAKKRKTRSFIFASTLSLRSSCCR